MTDSRITASTVDREIDAIDLVLRRAITRLEGSDPLDFQLREAREKLEALREFVVLPIFEKELRELDTTLGMIALPRSDPDFAKVVLQALDYRRDWLRKCLEARGPVDG